jgi:hypothetical protein
VAGLRGLFLRLERSLLLLLGRSETIGPKLRGGARWVIARWTVT